MITVTIKNLFYSKIFISIITFSLLMNFKISNNVLSCAYVPLFYSIIHCTSHQNISVEYVPQVGYLVAVSHADSLLLQPYMKVLMYIRYITYVVNIKFNYHS